MPRCAAFVSADYEVRRTAGLPVQIKQTRLVKGLQKNGRWPVVPAALRLAAQNTAARSTVAPACRCLAFQQIKRRSRPSDTRGTTALPTTPTPACAAPVAPPAAQQVQDLPVCHRRSARGSGSAALVPCWQRRCNTLKGLPTWVASMGGFDLSLYMYVYG